MQLEVKGIVTPISQFLCSIVFDFVFVSSGLLTYFRGFCDPESSPVQSSD